MPVNRLARFVLLPELKLINFRKLGFGNQEIRCEKAGQREFCPVCASPSESTYDHRSVRVKDAPLRGKAVWLVIRKRRLWCKTCEKPFTESIPGVRKYKRHTERFAREVVWAAEHFADLKRVRVTYRCSADFLYRLYYQRLAQRVREKINYPWTHTIGIDEHAFRKARYGAPTEFVTMVVDYDNRRVRELVLGKNHAALSGALANISGRENVRNVIVDLADPFKNFARNFFPNARIIADKFHVLRLLSPHLLKRRKQITGTRADLRAKKLLLMSIKHLDYSARHALKSFLSHHPELFELYTWKEKLHRLYRTPGYHNAARAFRKLTDQMSWSTLPEIKTLRRTLLRWQEEILNYFLTGLTNARTEGFNNKAKVVKRRAYGYKSYENYRLKVLTACA